MILRLTVGTGSLVCLVTGAITPTPFNGVDLLGVVLGAALIRTLIRDLEEDRP